MVGQYQAAAGPDTELAWLGRRPAIPMDLGFGPEPSFGFFTYFTQCIGRAVDAPVVEVVVPGVYPDGFEACGGEDGMRINLEEVDSLARHGPFAPSGAGLVFLRQVVFVGAEEGLGRPQCSQVYRFFPECLQHVKEKGACRGPFPEVGPDHAAEVGMLQVSLAEDPCSCDAVILFKQWFQDGDGILDRHSWTVGPGDEHLFSQHLEIDHVRDEGRGPAVRLVKEGRYGP